MARSSARAETTPRQSSQRDRPDVQGNAERFDFIVDFAPFSIVRLQLVNRLRKRDDGRSEGDAFSRRCYAVQTTRSLARSSSSVSSPRYRVSMHPTSEHNPKQICASFTDPLPPSLDGLLDSTPNRQSGPQPRSRAYSPRVYVDTCRQAFPKDQEINAAPGAKDCDHAAGVTGLRIVLGGSGRGGTPQAVAPHRSRGRRAMAASQTPSRLISKTRLVSGVTVAQSLRVSSPSS
jgi:hypothetical protein